MSTFCEHGMHDVPSIREPNKKLIHSVKACSSCLPDFLAKNMKVVDSADASQPRPE